MTSKADRFAALLGTNNLATKPKPVDQIPKAQSFCDTAPMGMEFSPILAVSKLPYKYMGHGQGETVAKQFFAAGKFWDREWDLWYVWSPHYSTEKPLIFIPAKQLVQLIKDIDSHFPSLMVRLPDNHEGSLTISFDDSEHKLLRPRFLGHSTNKDEYERLINSAPQFGPAAKGPDAADEEDITLFEQTMDQAVDATKNKSRHSKIKRQEARALKQKDLGRQLERTQDSLGLLSPETFEGDIIYIAVDVESYERNHSMITEVGFATLDTRDLRGKPPGQNGKDWHSCIRGRHFRIKEFRNYVNSDFVRGCPDSFEFGESEFISLKDAPQVVASCFKPPFSHPTATSTTAQDNETTEKRQIIFLGHDTKQDVNYLRNLGYDPSNLSNLVDFLDTGAMYRAVSGETQQRGLAFIMYQLELEAWNTHNAGNDAVYTMQALLGICVKDLEDKKKKKEVAEKEDVEGGGVALPVEEKQQQRKPELEVVKMTEQFEEWQM